MHTSEEVAAMSRCGFRSVRYLEVKNTLQKRFGTKDSVRCSEFRGGRFSEVANVLQVWDFQSVTRTLSALGSVSASRSVRSGRFYCIHSTTVLCDTAIYMHMYIICISIKS